MIVHVISDAGPHPYFRTLIEAGGMDRHNVMVGCVGPAGALQRDMAELGVATFALGVTGRARYPLAIARLARLLRRQRGQVVQAHLVDGCLVGLAAGRLARTPVTVMTAHHSHELPFHGPRLRWAERLIAGPLSDHIIAPSQQVADTIAREARVDPAKIAVVHHGFDMGRLAPGAADGRRVREELGLGDSLVLGAIGRLYRLKNVEALITAFAAIDPAGRDARLLIVGDGDATPLRDLVGRLGLASRVVLSPGRPDVPDLLAAMDVFVHPALAESFGMVIVEAMAMGRPVLSTPVGIAVEVIEPPRNGILATGTTPDDLAGGLREMLARREDWPQMGMAARRSVKGFTAQVMARRHEELYAEWLAQNRTGDHDSAVCSS